MRLNESRIREPRKGTNHQAVVFDFDLDGCLHPRGMPCAKNTPRAPVPEITTESLQRELSKRARAARTEALARLDVSTIGEAAARRAPTDNAPQTSVLVFVMILGPGEIAGQAERSDGQRQSPWPRQPAPKEKRTGLVVVSNVSAQVEEALFGNRCEQLRPERSGRVGAEATHGQHNEADDRSALVEFQPEARRKLSPYHRRLDLVVQEHDTAPFSKDQRFTFG